VTKRIAVLLMCAAVSLPCLAQSKVAKRIADSTSVLQMILSKQEMPTNVLNKAVCVLVFPSVKKVGIGLGVSYGRGVMACRSGSNMMGPWSPPAMYSLDTGSLGAQLGGTATDFVLLIMNPQAAGKALLGKLKLGADASATAGPSSASASAYDESSDILTYSQSKGLFAGASLGTASMSSDDSANKDLYGKDLTAAQIVRDGAVQVTPAGKPLDDLLTKYSPKHMM
jgi:SH3 domain-containing YSC84-like protein 1